MPRAKPPTHSHFDALVLFNLYQQPTNRGTQVNAHAKGACPQAHPQAVLPTLRIPGNAQVRGLGAGVLGCCQQHGPVAVPDLARPQLLHIGVDHLVTRRQDRQVGLAHYLDASGSDRGENAHLRIYEREYKAL